MIRLELEIFSENLYAVHSIEYQKLQVHFYVFATRPGVVWP
ncbi:RNA ligase family protein [Cesiribacter sp. SM1]|nr:RNA ligase family protein [Cesiribacter sp. SM1]